MSTKTQFSLPVERPNEAELLNLWLSARAAADIDVIRDSETYRHIWSTWCTYLASGRNGAQPKAIPWFDVMPETIVGFLGTGPSDRKTKTTSTSNQTTKRRYWRVLDRIYNFAAMNGWIVANPVKKLADKDVPNSENTEGTILHPSIWLAAEQLIADLTKCDAISVRNRALLQMLFSLGMAPQELRSLKTTSLKFEEKGAVGQGDQMTGVHIDGHGTLRPRLLKLSPKVSAAIAEWMNVRPTVATEASGDLLFCTPRGSISSVNLYLLVQSFLKKASHLAGREPPEQMGPQVIRNTLLVRMLEDGEHSTPWVAKFAGLKNVKGLWHLRNHCSEEVRATIKNTRDDADSDEAIV